MSIQKVYIYLDGKIKPPKNLDLSSKLSKVREQLKNSYSNNFIFIIENDDVEEADEKEWILEDIINHQNNRNLLYLKTKDLPANNEIEVENNTNSILNGSKKLYTKKKVNEEDIDLDIYQYPIIEFTEEQKEKAFTILVVGEIGAGKTTLINSFINVLMGVTINQNYRYVVSTTDQRSNESQFQTKEVSIYNIKTKDGKYYQILDTPGFYSIEGIIHDKIIFEKISKTLREQLYSINAICFAMKSGYARFPASLKFIFHEIFELFGEDVLPNIIIMFTFSDLEKPLFLDALQNSESIFNKIIPQIESPYYYVFNNSAFFTNDINYKFTKFFWKLGIDNFKGFINRLEKSEKISLNQTKEVLKERKNLQKLITLLQEKLTIISDKISKSKYIYENKNKLEKNVKDSEKFTCVVKVPKIRKIELPPGKCNTTCLICNITCHKNCTIADNSQLMNCEVMKDGNCIKCQKKCRWDNHKNLPYALEHYITEEIITLEDLKKRYYGNKIKMDNSLRILGDNKIELDVLNKECINIQENIIRIINRLKQIALNKDILFYEEDIEILIQFEESEKVEGFSQRAEALKIFKKEIILTKQAYENKIPELEELKKLLIEYSEKKNLQKESCNIN